MEYIKTFEQFVNESKDNDSVNEARSVSSIAKQMESTSSAMKSTVAQWKKAEGPAKDKFKEALKKLTEKKKELEKELNAAVSELDKNAELVVDESAETKIEE